MDERGGEVIQKGRHRLGGLSGGLGGVEAVPEGQQESGGFSEDRQVWEGCEGLGDPPGGPGGVGRPFPVNREGLEGPPEGSGGIREPFQGERGLGVPQ